MNATNTAPIFKTLNPDEEADFRQWARDHYAKDTPINPLWHPVVRAECDAINAQS